MVGACGLGNSCNHVGTAAIRAAACESGSRAQGGCPYRSCLTRAARVSVDYAAAVAEEFAGIDLDLQKSRDPGQPRLANELRCTAAACEVAEQRAIRAVFALTAGPSTDAMRRLVPTVRHDR